MHARHAALGRVGGRMMRQLKHGFGGKQMSRMSDVTNVLVDLKITNLRKISTAQLNSLFAFLDQDRSNGVSSKELLKCAELCEPHSLIRSQLEYVALFAELKEEEDGEELDMETFMSTCRLGVTKLDAREPLYELRGLLGTGVSTERLVSWLDTEERYRSGCLGWPITLALFVCFIVVGVDHAQIPQLYNVRGGVRAGLNLLPPEGEAPDLFHPAYVPHWIEGRVKTLNQSGLSFHHVVGLCAQFLPEDALPDPSALLPVEQRPEEPWECFRGDAAGIVSWSEKLPAGGGPSSVSLRVVLYNQLYHGYWTIAGVSFEFAHGGTTPTWDLQVVPNNYAGMIVPRWFSLLCDFVYLTLCSVSFAVHVWTKIPTSRDLVARHVTWRECLDGPMLVELSAMTFVLWATGVFASLIGSTSEVRLAARDQLGLFLALQKLANQWYWYRIALSCNAITIVARFLKVFRSNPRFSLVIRTISEGADDIAHFLVVFVVIYVAFAIWGTIVFGWGVGEYRDPVIGLNTAFAMIMGTFDYAELLYHDGWAAMVWFWSFNLFVCLLCVNMIMAIIMDAYMQVLSHVSKSTCTKMEFWKFFTWRPARSFSWMNYPPRGMGKALAASKRDNFHVAELRALFPRLSVQQATVLIADAKEHALVHVESEWYAVADVVRIVGRVELQCREMQQMMKAVRHGPEDGVPLGEPDPMATAVGRKTKAAAATADGICESAFTVLQRMLGESQRARELGESQRARELEIAPERTPEPQERI